MNKTLKYIIFFLIFVLIGVGVFLIVKNMGNDDKKENGDDVNTVVSDDSKLEYLLEGYPIDEVPLYKLTEVSSSKYIINFDPKNTSYFDHTNFAYYNVVLYTQASQSEFLEYYKNLFDEEIVDEYPMPDMVKGTIGKYRVTAAHYDSYDTGYIQVYLPNSEFTKENKYFDKYPDLFEMDNMFVEHENSYGLLNQVGGQTEYTKYFTVLNSGDQNNDGLDDVDEFGVLISKYQDLYNGKDEYTYDTNTGYMKWKEDGYSVTVSFSRDHGRIYLNMRGSII